MRSYAHQRRNQHLIHYPFASGYRSPSLCQNSRMPLGTWRTHGDGSVDGRVGKAGSGRSPDSDGPTSGLVGSLISTEKGLFWEFGGLLGVRVAELSWSRCRSEHLRILIFPSAAPSGLLRPPGGHFDHRAPLAPAASSCSLELQAAAAGGNRPSSPQIPRRS